MSEALALLQQAQMEDSFVVIIAPVSEQSCYQASAVIVETAEQADTVIDMLFTPENHNRFSASSDYVSVWHGSTFVCAYLANGKMLNQDTFIRYIEEWLV